MALALSSETSPRKKDDSNVGFLLSEYQKQRLDNIRRNNERLRSLGLLSVIEEERSNALAAASEMGITQRHAQSAARFDDVGNEECGHQINANRKRKKPSNGAKTKTTNAPSSVEGSRKSRRLQGMQADLDRSSPHCAANEDGNGDEEDDQEGRLWKERTAIVEECRRARLRTANALVAEMGGEEGAARDNPTATYDHCLMRVRSMTDRALANRVKAIERACGKHCVIKMAIFKSCLQDEGKWELASQASEALERLKTLKPVPKD
jgi:hypothetical protein